MPVEIRQLVVKARVRDARPEAQPPDEKDENGRQEEVHSLSYRQKEELIREITQRVLEQLKAQTDR